MTVELSANSRRSLWSALTRRLEFRMLVLAIVLAAMLSLLSPYFLTKSNLFNLLDQSVVTGIVAVGMTFVILTGGIDLSVGSVAGLTGIILGLALHSFPLPIAIVIGGPVRRRHRADLRLPDRLFRSGGLRRHARHDGDRAEPRLHLLRANLDLHHPAGVVVARLHRCVSAFPANVLFLGLLYLAAWAYLTYTKGGRTIYAVGSNKEAARAAGLNVFFYSVCPMSSRARFRPSRSRSRSRNSFPPIR